MNRADARDRGGVESDIRARLRSSTAAAHERLHGHRGFAAVAAGTISLGRYRLLLARLLGFHSAFERALSQFNRQSDAGVAFEARARSRLLEADLAALGVDRAAVRALPQCATLLPPRSVAEFLGALYVIEGSTLGGLHLARALGPLLGADTADGRAFFLGYGDQHSAMWRSFLDRLNNCAANEADAAAVVDGATRTFCDFESWMEGWDAPSAIGAAALSLEAAR
jgi:heme oxygenase